MKYFNVLIRVCKKIQGLDSMDFGNKTIVQETIKAKSKEEAKKIILEKYPQFFQNGKVYSRQTKDKAQFFYVLLYEYSDWHLKEGEKEWECDFCKKKHENSIESEHLKVKNRKFEGKFFCSSPNPKVSWNDEIDFVELKSCASMYEEDFYKKNNLEDNQYYVHDNSKYYIYKITEKESGKSYIGQTRNEPFFRWWQHLSHSSSPFGIYLRQTELSDWTFEVLESRSHSTSYDEILKIESKYIIEYDAIENGFNSVISKKE